MARRDRYSQAPMGQTYVVLLIGVLMSLMLFWLLAATFGRYCCFDPVRVPTADRGQRMPERRLVVNVAPIWEEYGQSQILVRGQQVKVDELASVIRAVREEAPDAFVVVRADRQLKYEVVSPVLAACASADNGKMHLVVECW